MTFKSFLQKTFEFVKGEYADIEDFITGEITDVEPAEDYITQMLREVHKKNIKDKQEAKDLMESWKKNPELIK